MKYFLLALLFFSLSSISNAQSVIQSINSGSIISSNSMVTVGEIFVVPENQNQTSSGIIGILTIINEENLSVSEFDVSENIVVFPNPTTTAINFRTKTNLVNEKVFIFSNSGQLVKEIEINSSNSIDLTDLSTGIYFIQFENKKYNAFKIIKQ
ncbi:MAG TPA: T9SS type A sorting domain-containing protein [Flavobacterium sp.]|uniref:T9SS type A sorting domain-containing protein n=2 Tax=Flavobacterium TaxID=237 RepID=UPI0025BBD744|nr:MULTISPECIES: T9SS type A sorting domain-containing protein [unclassified Flavobacterium]HRE76932.1 T9SS type A sorting domain-containing protein [Flavobacterium sp.]